jgi:hypothetical protein
MCLAQLGSSDQFESKLLLETTWSYLVQGLVSMEDKG